MFRAGGTLPGGCHCIYLLKIVNTPDAEEIIINLTYMITTSINIARTKS